MSIETFTADMNQVTNIHLEKIKALIPDGIKNAPAHRLQSIKANVEVAQSYQRLPAAQQQRLNLLLKKHWGQQAELDSLLGALKQDIQAFAKPLLTDAIKAQFAVDLDVERTILKLYIPDKIIFGIDRGATRSRHSSLLDAALHNFDESETEERAFRSGSGLYTTDGTGALKLHATVTAEQFATLCRKLDIGTLYQNHLKSLLTPTDAKQQQALRTQAVAVEKSALESAAMIALMKSDVSNHGHGIVEELLSGKSDIKFNGKHLKAHRLRIMGFPLSGIVLFSAVAEKTVIEKAIQSLLPDELLYLFDWSRRIPGLNDNAYEKYKVLSDVFANGPEALTEEYSRRADFYDQSRLTGPLVAYVPDDPRHPLKEYPSLTDFMKELVIQLREPAYQEFFSRFVAQKDKPKFFKRANERLKELTWHQREPLDMGPWWRETPIENPNVEPITVPIPGDLWSYLYRQKRDKAIADARLIAVPTGDEDAKARWHRLVSYLDIGWNVFNFAVMLVPGMGEVMLGVMVAQVMAEFAEGIEDWSQGDKDEANAHFMSVIINFAQLALMSVGHVVPGGAAPIKPSPFVDNLKPVSLPDGSTRMWNPDLAPYEHKTPLPAGSMPDELGLHQHRGKQVLRLEDKQYVVKEDTQSSQHRLQHPSRAEAYAPVVEHNSAGAWKTEIEHPIEWEKARLLRRLNPLASTFSETTLEHVLTVSGVEEDVLRRLHVEHDVPPPLLSDTLNRFDLHARTSQLGAQIRSGVIDENLAGYLPGLMTELPRWPESKAITLRDPLPTGRESVTYGNANATPDNTLTVTLDELKAGKLESRVLESLEEPEIEGLLGRAISTKKTLRREALREELAARANKRNGRIFESQYEGAQESTDPRVGRLRGDYPDLPCNMVEQLLKDADPQDLRFLKEKNRIALKLRQQIQAARDKVRLSRAYEGLYLDQLENIDTRRLELCSVQSLPGWSSDVRIEVREFSFTGKVQASVGPQGATIRKVLILDEQGRYNARDEQGQHLHGADDFYGSLLHALPDAERKALGYEIFQGDKLQEAVRHSPLGHEQFESVLLDHPVRKPAYDPQSARLHGGMLGYPLRRPGWTSLRGRLHSLYPSFTEAEVETMLNGFGVDAADRRVQALEYEFNTFNRTFQNWMVSPTQASRFSPAGVAEYASRDRLYKALRQCLQRTGPEGIEAPGIVRPQALFLEGSSLDQHLPAMPLLTANFDHVTQMSLRNAGLISRHQYFLAPFRQLRRLNLTANRLNALPKSITDMRYLRDLLLSDNRIVLTDESVARLRTMKRLTALKLDGNPLGLVPDISQMPRLLILFLSDTGVDTWPTGLFAHPRPRHMVLDLRFNPISRLPTVAPGSMSAEMIARTYVSRDPRWMSAENLDQLKLYIESVGLDPERPYPPLGTIDSSFWDEGMTQDEWNARQPIWDAVEDEFGSEHFFRELKKLTESADFKSANVQYKAELTAKVWRMLAAMEENTELRTDIFEQAAAATSCGDAGAQFFNAMGVRVLVHEALKLSNIDLVEAELVWLARGKTRLDELGAIARLRVAERFDAGERFRRVVDGDVIGTIDEVEVHMAYMTDLAERLDLPWQSRGMLFRSMAGVTPEMIEAAYKQVIAHEKGDLLAPWIVDQPFWDDFLDETYKQELDNAVVGIPDDDTIAQFAAKKALKRTLTQQAIDRAKLQRVEIPLTVAP